MSDLRISEMTISDFEEIKGILQSDFDEFWTPEILKQELEGENKKYIIAKKRDEIVGFAGLMLNLPDCEIMNIVVKKTNRKNGIGNILLNKLFEIAKNNNAEKIFLEVNEENVFAQKLYYNNGFEEIGRRKKYYNSKYDAIIMSKKLNNL